MSSPAHVWRLGDAKLFELNEDGSFPTKFEIAVRYLKREGLAKGYPGRPTPQQRTAKKIADYLGMSEMTVIRARRAINKGLV